LKLKFIGKMGYNENTLSFLLGTGQISYKQQIGNYARRVEAGQTVTLIVDRE